MCLNGVHRRQGCVPCTMIFPRTRQNVSLHYNFYCILCRNEHFLSRLLTECCLLDESIQFSDTPYFVVKYSIFATELGMNFVALTALLTRLPEGVLLHKELRPTSLLLHF
jgi:hypothetical protein